MIIDRLSNLYGLVLAMGVGFWVINSGAVDKLLANGVLGYSAVISALEWLRKDEDRLRALVIAQVREHGQDLLERIVAEARDVQPIAPLVFDEPIAQAFSQADSLEDWEPDLQPDMMVQPSPPSPLSQGRGGEDGGMMAIEALVPTSLTKLKGLTSVPVDKGERWIVSSRSALGIWDGAQMTIVDANGDDWIGINSHWQGVV